tara:strand:- start:113 stop:580 length:468 start_codon:yes stop_codon:yes gene_type:complete
VLLLNFYGIKEGFMGFTYKGVEITEDVVGRKVLINKSGSGNFDNWVGEELTISAINEDNGSIPITPIYIESVGYWIGLDEGDEFEWVDGPEIIKTNKTQRKTIANNLRHQIDKINQFIHQAELSGIIVVLDQSSCNTVDITEISYQPKTPPKEEY